MRFVFSDTKATQATAYLLNKYPNQEHNYMAILKMLYLADRLALTKRGYPITGDTMFSMQHGPVLSEIYNLMTAESEQPGIWTKTLRTNVPPYSIAVISDPGIEDLSEFETNILDEIHERHGKLTQWQLRDLTHTLPEWDDPGSSSNPIRPETILREAGYDNSEIRQMTEDAEHQWFLDARLSMPSASND